MHCMLHANNHTITTPTPPTIAEPVLCFVAAVRAPLFVDTPTVTSCRTHAQTKTAFVFAHRYLGSVGPSAINTSVKNGGVGGLQCAEDAATCIQQVNELQAALKTRTRLGIPVSVFAETTHSGGFFGSTIFPMPGECACKRSYHWNTIAAQCDLVTSRAR